MGVARFVGVGRKKLATIALVVSIGTVVPASAFHEDLPRCGPRTRYAIENPEDGYVEVYFPRVPAPFLLPFPLAGGGIGTWLGVPGAWLFELDPSLPPYFLYDVAVCHVSIVTATLSLTGLNAPPTQTQRFGRRGECSGRDVLGGIFDVPLGVSFGELSIVARPCHRGSAPIVDRVDVHFLSLQAGSY